MSLLLSMVAALTLAMTPVPDGTPTPAPMAWTSVLESLPYEGHEVSILRALLVESRGYWTDDEPPFLPQWWEASDGADEPIFDVTHWEYIL